MHRALLLSLIIAVPVVAASRPLRVPLAFTPQEGASSTTADVRPAVREVPLEVVIEEGRPGDPLVIGQGTDDDDETFDIVALTPPVDFVRSSAERVLASWKISTKVAAVRQLKVRVSEFAVEESNKAVGSTYSASVSFAYTLTSKGETLLAGTASGSAERYGRARSAANCNEVLSDALKDALATMLSSASLQEAWVSGKAVEKTPEPSAMPDVETRLQKLKELLDRGVITHEEHDARRAEILKEL